MGVEANTLYRFGLDRNGVAFPIMFIGWGDGQHTPYAYMLIPIIALVGRLGPAIVRFPMLLTGIVSLPLVYWVGRRILDEQLGLLTMFFLAISPWHIVLSRWAFEGNLLPWVFLLAFACLLEAGRDGRWFVPGLAFAGMTLYVYATSYAFLPIFVGLTLTLLVWSRAAARKYVIGGLLSLIVIALPIVLFVIVNSIDLDSIALGPFTIPRFPMPPRYETQTLLAGLPRFRTLGAHLAIATSLLVTQTDGLPQNSVDPFGFFYVFTVPLLIIGLMALIARARNRQHRWEAGLLLAWMLASVPIAIIQDANINRLNILIIPVLICMALGLRLLGTRVRALVPITIVALSFGFLAFTRIYHGPEYRKLAGAEFELDLLSALRFAQHASDGPICVSGGHGREVYALFTDPMKPAEYLDSMRYDDPGLPGRTVISLGRYTFGKTNCQGSEPYTYVLQARELPPRLGHRYSYEFFDNFVVYYPAP